MSYRAKAQSIYFSECPAGRRDHVSIWNLGSREGLTGPKFEFGGVRRLAIDEPKPDIFRI
jgi:hypothetical protein